MTIIIHHYIFLKIIGYRVQKQCFQVQDPWSLYDDILTFFRIRALKWTHFSSQFLLPVKILSRTVCDAWSFKQRYWSTSIIACYGVRSLQCYRCRYIDIVSAAYSCVVCTPPSYCTTSWWPWRLSGGRRTVVCCIVYHSSWRWYDISRCYGWLCALL